jgi:hypothetical protein
MEVSGGSRRGGNGTFHFTDVEYDEDILDYILVHFVHLCKNLQIRLDVEVHNCNPRHLGGSNRKSAICVQPGKSQ